MAREPLRCELQGISVRYGPVERSRAHPAHGPRHGHPLRAFLLRRGLQLRVGAVPVAAVVVESTRREDARPENVERWERGLDRAAHEVFAAALDDRLRGRGGFGLDVDAPDGRAFVEWLARAGKRAVRRCSRSLGHPGATGMPPRSGGAPRGARWFGARGPLALVAPGGARRRLRACHRSGRGPARPWSSRSRRGAGRSSARSSNDRRSGEAGRRARPDHAAGCRRGGAADERARARQSLPGLERRRHWIPSIARAVTGAIEGPSRHDAPSRGGRRCALASATGPRRPRPRRSPAFRRVNGPGSPRRSSRRPRESSPANGASGPAARGDLSAISRLPRWTARTSRGRPNVAGAARLMGWDPSTFAARARAAGLIEAAHGRSPDARLARRTQAKRKEGPARCAARWTLLEVLPWQEDG